MADDCKSRRTIEEEGRKLFKRKRKIDASMEPAPSKIALGLLALCFFLTPLAVWTGHFLLS
jgi:hypothetical protein